MLERAHAILERLDAFLARIKRVVPFVSLATGIAGAVLMNRSPGRAWIVVVAAVVGFIVLVVANLVRIEGSTLAHKGMRYAIALSNQVAIQQALLFPLPFYLRSAKIVVRTETTFALHAPEPEHAAFFVVYACALVVALWDPLFKRAMTSTSAAFALQAFAAFVGLDMVLPVLGASNATSLVIAGVATAIAVPLAIVVRPATTTTWKVRTIAGVGAIVVAVAARLAAPFIPPAPLELVSIAIGTGVVDHELVGASDTLATGTLTCHSAIRAPLGLHDALLHVWSKNGVRFTPVPLDVRGGRDAGFRTWSTQPIEGAGDVRCSVETASGQVLGSARATVH